MIISSISGPEPLRHDEHPDFYSVGRNDVTHIDEVREYHGTHETVWFHVFAGEKLVAKMNAVYTANVSYR